MLMVLLNQSLWARFIRAKYFVGNQLLIPQTASPIWRSMTSHYTELWNSLRWLVGCGDKSFWLDNWVGQILVGPQPVDATLTIAQGLAAWEN